MANIAAIVAAADDAATHLRSTVKLTKITFEEGTVCPEHPDRGVCDCEDAMATVPDAQKPDFVTIEFIAKFERFLLEYDAAFSFTGTQASHHAFESAMPTNNGSERWTPKTFVREFLDREDSPFQRSFTYAGRKEDTVIALVELWVKRNAQWRAVYGSHSNAKDNWIRDVYADIIVASQNALREAADRRDNPLGKERQVHYLVTHPDDERLRDQKSKIEILAWDFKTFRLVAKQPAYEIEAVIKVKEYCHDNYVCQNITENKIGKAWADMLQELAAKQFGMRRRAAAVEVLQMSEVRARIKATVSWDPRAGWGEDEEGEVRQGGDEDK